MVEQALEELEAKIIELNEKVMNLERIVDTILQAGRPTWTPSEGQTTIDSFVTSEHA